MNNNKHLSDAQWIKLKEASPHFENSRHNFVRNCPRWLVEDIIQVYEDFTGRTVLNKNNLACAQCVLNIIKLISKLYFDELSYRETEKQQKIEDEKTDNRETNSGDKEKAPGDNGSNKKRKAKVKDTTRTGKEI